MHIASLTIMGWHLSSGSRRFRTWNSAVNDSWIANRMGHIDASGIRKAFDMAKTMKNPINLSIGLPDFDVALPVKAAAIEAIRSGKNQYTVTQGLPELRNRLQTLVDSWYHHADREVLVTSGTAGGLLLAICAVVNPGDEVIIFDPSFVMYRHQVTLAGGTSVLVDTIPTSGSSPRRSLPASVRAPNASSSTRR